MTTAYFDYGPSGSSYCYSTIGQDIASGTTNVHVSAPISGLACGRTYLFAAVATGGSVTNTDYGQTFVTLACPGNFNGDGKTDILWRHTSGAVYVWLMNGTTVASGASLPTTDTSWSIVGTGDFNGDGKTDILWHHTSGAVYAWLMNGTTVASGVSLPSADPSWSIVGPK
jgi:hypothetical protein